MVERRLQPIEDVAIDPGRLADDLESEPACPAPERGRGPGRESRESHRPAAACGWQHLMMQPARKVLATAGKFLDSLDRLGQAVQISERIDRSFVSRSRSAAGRVLALARQSVFQKLESFHQSSLLLLSSRQSDQRAAGSRCVCTSDSPASPIKGDSGFRPSPGRHDLGRDSGRQLASPAALDLNFRAIHQSRRPSSR